MQCPSCKLLNPPEAKFCSCGYGFTTGRESAIAKVTGVIVTLVGLAFGKAYPLATGVALIFFALVGLIIWLIKKRARRSHDSRKPKITPAVFRAFNAVKHFRSPQRMEQNSAFKTCPFCQEQIRNEAVKCRYCGEWFEEKTKNPAAAHAASQVTRSVPIEARPVTLSTPIPSAPPATATNTPLLSTELIYFLTILAGAGLTVLVIWSTEGPHGVLHLWFR